VQVVYKFSPGTDVERWRESRTEVAFLLVERLQRFGIQFGFSRRLLATPSHGERISPTPT
jgi:hypothetical protein